MSEQRSQWQMISEALGLGPDSLADSFRRLAVRDLRAAADIVEEGGDADEKLGRVADTLLLVEMFEAEARRLAGGVKTAVASRPRPTEATNPRDDQEGVATTVEPRVAGADG